MSGYESSEKYSKKTTKRSLLKGAGAAATGLAGFSGLTTATKGDIAKVRNATPSRVLLEELGNPTIRDSVKVESDDIEGVILYTDIGRLIYVKVDGEEAGVQFQVEPPSAQMIPKERSGRSRGSRERGGRRNARDEPVPTRARGQPSESLPARGRIVKDLHYQDIPENGKATLMVTPEEEVEYIRTPTDQEIEKLETATGLAADESIMFYCSGIDGYEVHSTKGVSTHDDVRRDASTDQPATADMGALQRNDTYFVHPTGAGIHGDLRVEKLDTDEVAAQGDCLYWFGKCAEAIGTCVVCAGACVVAGITTIAGAVTCLACWFGCHFFIPVACGKAANACGCGSC